MPAILSAQPRNACLLRLSAIGDTCHVLALVRTLQRAWPGTRFTWVIGRIEAKLMGSLDDVELITFDKRGGLEAIRRTRAALAAREFDVMLHLQLALRASLLAGAVRAPVKLGFDRARARELQWLFTNARIAPREREHVLDSLFGFAAALGITDRELRWDLPLPPDAHAYAAEHIADGQRTLVISPCASHTHRNWLADRYARVAEHAHERHGLTVILAGGRSELERRTGDAILAATRAPIIDTIGKDTLPQLLGLLGRATALLTPDSGPAHMATMVGTPVIGLYACTNPARSGPYLSREWCVDRYEKAARQFRGKLGADLPWTTKIEQPGVMDLITVEDVTERLDALLAAGGRAAVLPPRLIGGT